MPFPSSERRSKATMTVNEVEPNQEEIEREIAKLKEDSAKDVERQLAQQQLAAREGRVKEEAKKAVEDVKEDLAPAWKAVEQEVETIVKDAEADVKGVRRLGGRLGGAERE